LLAIVPVLPILFAQLGGRHGNSGCTNQHGYDFSPDFCGLAAISVDAKVSRYFSNVVANQQSGELLAGIISALALVGSPRGIGVKAMT